MLFTTIALRALVAAACASLVAAAPAPGVAMIDIVYDPTITAPKAGAVWHAGETQVVTWDTSNLPAGEAGQTGTLILGYQQNNSENLDLSKPLATGFQITAGQVNLTVPAVAERNDYIVVLFGDSGNASGQFTILNGTSSSVSSAASSATPSVQSSAASPTSTVVSATPTSILVSATPLPTVD